jgi:hypothetical protein
MSESYSTCFSRTSFRDLSGREGRIGVHMFRSGLGYWGTTGFMEGDIHHVGFDMIVFVRIRSGYVMVGLSTHVMTRSEEVMEIGKEQGIGINI